MYTDQGNLYLPPPEPELVIAFTADGMMHLIDLAAIQSLVDR